MKNFRRFSATIILALAFTIPVFSGEMSAPGVTNPPPPPQSSVAGEIPGPGVTSNGEMSAPGVTALDPVTEAALSLLQSILALF